MNNDMIMSKKEQNRIPILQQVIDKRITGIEAAKILGVHRKTITRSKEKFIKHGSRGIQHKARGKPSKKRFKKQFIDKIKEIIFDPIYKGFGPTLLSEKLYELHKIKINKESLRKIMIEIKTWIPNTRGTPKFYRKRRRKDGFGEMIQFDGSYHKWLEDRNGGNDICLLSGVDDATGRIYLEFGSGEGYKSVASFWKRYTLEIGVPKMIYVDKHTTYKSPGSIFYKDKESLSQFQIACKTVGIELKHANSAQAKGRVERFNGILQDRLVKEMRLLGIDNIKDANKYLEETYIKKHNNKFSILPFSDQNHHRQLENKEIDNLDYILGYYKIRSINNDYTISYNSKTYQLYQGAPRIYPKQKVSVQESFDGDLSITLRNKPIKFDCIDTRPIKIEEKTDRKTNNELAKERHLESKKRQYRYKANKLLKLAKSIEKYELKKQYSK